MRKKVVCAQKISLSTWAIWLHAKCVKLTKHVAWATITKEVFVAIKRISQPDQELSPALQASHLIALF